MGFFLRERKNGAVSSPTLAHRELLLTHYTEINNFPASHDFCHLLSHLPMYLSSLYCKQYGPRSDCSLRSSLIRVHSVCFHDESSLEYI